MDCFIKFISVVLQPVWLKNLLIFIQDKLITYSFSNNFHEHLNLYVSFANKERHDFLKVNNCNINSGLNERQSENKTPTNASYQELHNFVCCKSLIFVVDLHLERSFKSKWNGYETQ